MLAISGPAEIISRVSDSVLEDFKFKLSNNSAHNKLLHSFLFTKN